MNILVTGGASGLGYAITTTLAERYDKVFFTYNSSNENAIQIESDFKNCQGIKCNFSNSEELELLCNRIENLNISILINNAWSGLEKKHFHKIDDSLHVQSFANNLNPTILITKACLKQFKKKKDGSIITILSSAILNTPPIGWSTYVAEKTYLLSLSKAWATEYAKFNITSNCISPSMMMTNMTADMDERILENITKSHPRKALLTTKEVAHSVVSLLDMSKHINGINMIINAAQNVI